MRRLILKLLPLLLLAVSCTERMDPYEGGTGVRANINGYKCVMRGVSNKSYATYNVGESYSFSTQRLQLFKHMDGMSNCYLQVSISEPSALVTGKAYKIGTSGATAYLYLDGVDRGITLSGELTFLNDGPGSGVTEARFELSGKDRDGTKYDVRHGFKRLNTTKMEEQEYEE